MVDYKITSNSGIAALDEGCKKLKTKPDDFEYIVKAGFIDVEERIEKEVSPVVMEEPITNDEDIEEIIKPYVMPQEEVSKEEEKHNDEEIVNDDKHEFTIENAFVGFDKKEEEKAAYTKSAPSILDNNSETRINTKASYIINASEKVSASSDKDYDRTLVNGASKLKEIESELDDCSSLIEDIKKNISLDKAIIDAKKSDLALIDKDLQEKFPQVSFTAILGRGKWNEDELQLINDIYSKIKDNYGEILNIINNMKHELSLDDEELKKKETSLKEAETKKEKILDDKKETVIKIEDALRMASDSDKYREEAEEIKKKLEAEIEKRNTESNALREKNTFLNENHESSKISHIKELEALKERALNLKEEDVVVSQWNRA